MAKSRGFPVTRLNLSSSAADDEGADVDGPPDERLRGPAVPPTERRPEEEDGRWIGGGWRLLRLLPAPPPRPAPPPPRLSLPECPYIDEVRGRFYGAVKKGLREERESNLAITRPGIMLCLFLFTPPYSFHQE